MKKFSALLLALLILATSLVSCTSGKEQETQPESVVNTNESIELPARDFGAKEFRILDANDHPTSFINFSESMEGTALQQALYEKDRYLETRNNVDIVYTQTTTTDVVGIPDFTNSYDAGDRAYDVVVSTASGSGRLPTVACSGRLLDLNTLPTLDLGGRWWSSLMNESMSLGGKMYFTTGDIMACMYQAPLMVYANRTLLEQYQIDDDLYQIVKDGEWTIEYMTSITRDLSYDINQDSMMYAEDDFFAIISEQNRMTAVGLLVGMGYDNSYIQNDQIIVNYDLEQLSTMCDALRKMLIPHSFNDKYANSKTFATDRAVFRIHLLGSSSGYRDMLSDFMVLPMPKGSVEQESYRSYINGWVGSFVAVPAFKTDDTEKMDLHGYMLEAMARASYEIVRPIAFDQVLKYQTMRDQGSVDMLEIISNTLYLDFQGVFDFGGQGTRIAEHVFKNADLVSSMENIKSLINTQAAEKSRLWLNPDLTE